MSHPQNKPICLIRSIQKEWKNLKIVWKSLFFEIIHVEVLLPEEEKLNPETIDSTYWKVP
jgi:hypothetical protein